ncbi:hypothetical protein BUALT_Bualt02G0149300 [Buddleja alternifolia]|uniref:SHSP domain-containing protein n=1 Tax=Buddleja alternifolia TaxID=168488 RepID=A0AAV6Y1V6_9LAMI|nr:hypothetical protein BUALT_Bualt02G0149300 [Buddleja alternifolia]
MAGRARLEKENSSLMFTQITPPHEWKEDSDHHSLRLTLPGFEAKDVTIHVDKYGHLVVRGNKQVSDHKYINFEESFNVPKNGNIEDADGFFEEDQIYCITIPKTKQQTGHAITIMPNPSPMDNINPRTQDNSPKAPQQDNKVGSFRKYGSAKQQEKAANNPLKVITADKSKKKIVFFIIAILIALLIIAVPLIIKFRH